MTTDCHSAQNKNVNSIRVLTIEDNPADIEIIQEALGGEEDGRYIVTGRDYLNDGLDFLAENTVDIVLLDLNLPDSRGIDTFYKVRAAAPHVPVLILTGYQDEDLALESLKEGAEDYISKNYINQSMMDRVIRYSIERFRLKAEILENQQLRELTLESSNSGYIILDSENEIIYANSIARDLLRNEENRQLSLLCANPACIEEPQHYQISDESGRPMTYEVTASSLSWKSRPATLVTVADLTRRLEIEALEKETDGLKKIQQLAGAIAHEFSQPLQILGYTAEFIKMEQGESERLNTIFRNVNRITELVRKLRKIVRMQTMPYLSTEILDLVKSSGETQGGKSDMAHKACGEDKESQVEGKQRLQMMQQSGR